MTHLFFYFFFFFFSSRRRHTRLQGDWSSDVCSSDLTVTALLVDLARSLARHGLSLLAVANAHLDPAHLGAIEAAVTQIRRADGARIVFPDVTKKPWAVRLTEEFRSGACHAGQYESSIVP